MGNAFQTFLRSSITVFACLILIACSDDVGLDQHGQKVAAERLQGQWLVINYWAEWCAPCRTEIPELNALSSKLAKESVQVVGVNFDALRGKELGTASDAMGIKFTVLEEDPAPRFKLPRAEALPVTYIVDDKGQMRERLLGEQTAAGITKRLQALRDEG